MAEGVVAPRALVLQRRHLTPVAAAATSIFHSTGGPSALRARLQAASRRVPACAVAGGARHGSRGSLRAAAGGTRQVPDTHPKPDGYRHGCEFVSTGTGLGMEFYPQPLCLRVGICFTCSVPDLLPSLLEDGICTSKIDLVYLPKSLCALLKLVLCSFQSHYVYVVFLMDGFIILL